jgi:hypothetical protein
VTCYRSTFEPDERPPRLVLSADDPDVAAGMLAAVIAQRLGDVVTITTVDGNEFTVTLVDVVPAACRRSVRAATFAMDLTDSPDVALREIPFVEIASLHIW